MGNLNNGALARNDSRRVALVTGGSRGIGRIDAAGIDDGDIKAVLRQTDSAGAADTPRAARDQCHAT